MNELMRDFLQGKKDYNDKEIQKYFLDKDNSIIWNREYGNDLINCDQVEQVLKMLNVEV